MFEFGPLKKSGFKNIKTIAITSVCMCIVVINPVNNNNILFYTVIVSLICKSSKIQLRYTLPHAK